MVLTLRRTQWLSEEGNQASQAEAETAVSNRHGNLIRDARACRARDAEILNATSIYTILHCCLSEGVPQGHVVTSLWALSIRLGNLEEFRGALGESKGNLSDLRHILMPYISPCTLFTACLMSLNMQ